MKKPKQIWEWSRKMMENSGCPIKTFVDISQKSQSVSWVLTLMEMGSQTMQVINTTNIDDLQFV